MRLKEIEINTCLRLDAEKNYQGNDKSKFKIAQGFNSGQTVKKVEKVTKIVKKMTKK